MEESPPQVPPLAPPQVPEVLPFLLRKPRRGRLVSLFQVPVNYRNIIT